MKKLTFREVIANIKQGEVWEDDIFEVDCTESEAIGIKDKRSGFVFSFHKEDNLQLKRKKYSFAEAFKAFEDGKEIKSCEGWKFKNDGNKVIVSNDSGASFKESSTNGLFSLKEMRGEWYIND